jgi:hypothetical protein
MQQEIMRVCVLLAALGLEEDFSPAELQELRALSSILRRASRAQAATDLRILEATASGAPQPTEKELR